MTITEIRARFPHPRSAKGDAPDDCDYCVGGALFLSLLPLPMHRYGYHTRFPQVETLAASLRDHNPRLSEGSARRFAGGIIEANDREHFEMAWHIAQAALAV